MTGRQGEPALVRRGRHVVHVQDPGHGLLLQPFEGVARIDAGARGEVGSRRRATVAQRGVEPQPIPEVDGLELHRRGHDLAHPPREGVAAFGVDVGRFERRRTRSGPPISWRISIAGRRRGSAGGDGLAQRVRQRPMDLAGRM